MRELREYCDTLRALGRFLETAGALEIAVSEEANHLSVSWRTKGGDRLRRQYGAFELQALRTAARLFRGLEGGDPRFTREEMLRTLGRQLDDMGAEGIGLVETPDGFWVSARVRGERVECLYTFDELTARSHEYHRARLPAVTAP